MAVDGPGTPHQTTTTTTTDIQNRQIKQESLDWSRFRSDYDPYRKDVAPLYQELSSGFPGPAMGPVYTGAVMPSMIHNRQIVIQNTGPFSHPALNRADHPPPPKKKKSKKNKKDNENNQSLSILNNITGEIGVKHEGVTEHLKERKKRDRFNGMSEEEVVKRTLPDILTPDLDIVIVGINPGLTAAYVGHHYAGPGNHFWKCLYLSGLITEPLNAYDDEKMLKYGVGFTNIVERTTKGSSDLTRKEIKDGGEIMVEKIKKYKPKIAVFNGKGIYEIFCGHKNFYIGKQPEPFPGAEDTAVFVMPSSSARCSQLPRAIDKVPFYLALKKLRDHLRGDFPDLDEAEVCFPDLELKVEPKKDKDGNLKIKKENGDGGKDKKIKKNGIGDGSNADCVPQHGFMLQPMHNMGPNMSYQDCHSGVVNQGMMNNAQGPHMMAGMGQQLYHGHSFNPYSMNPMFSQNGVMTKQEMTPMGYGQQPNIPNSVFTSNSLNHFSVQGQMPHQGQMPQGPICPQGRMPQQGPMFTQGQMPVHGPVGALSMPQEVDPAQMTNHINTPVFQHQFMNGQSVQLTPPLQQQFNQTAQHTSPPQHASTQQAYLPPQQSPSPQINSPNPQRATPTETTTASQHQTMPTQTAPAQQAQPTHGVAPPQQSPPPQEASPSQIHTQMAPPVSVPQTCSMAASSESDSFPQSTDSIVICNPFDDSPMSNRPQSLQKRSMFPTNSTGNIVHNTSALNPTSPAGPSTGTFSLTPPSPSGSTAVISDQTESSCDGGQGNQDPSPPCRMTTPTSSSPNFMPPPVQSPRPVMHPYWSFHPNNSHPSSCHYAHK